MMTSPVMIGFFVSLGMGLGAFAFFLWAVMAGQMEDAEEVKYRIIQREEDDDAKGNQIRLSDNRSKS